MGNILKGSALALAIFRSPSVGQPLLQGTPISIYVGETLVRFPAPFYLLTLLVDLEVFLMPVWWRCSVCMRVSPRLPLLSPCSLPAHYPYTISPTSETLVHRAAGSV